MWFLDIFRSRLSTTLTIKLILIALPLFALGAWRVIENERATVKDFVLEQGRVAALSGAASYSAILTTGIDSGAITMKGLFDPEYEEIVYVRGPDGRTKEAHFPADADAPKLIIEKKRYHTSFDAYTDTHGIQEIQDAILKSGPFVYSSGLDRGGYTPTPHKQYSELPTGDFKRDKAVSRIKRKYDEDEQLTAARYIGNEPTIVLDYHRDTGEPIWDVVAPITVKGKHWGAFRVGVIRDLVALRAFALAGELALSLGVTIGLMMFALFFTTLRALRPLKDLQLRATEISGASSGQELAAPIRLRRKDEIGDLSVAFDHLRMGFIAAFDRYTLLEQDNKRLHEELGNRGQGHHDMIANQQAITTKYNRLVAEHNIATTKYNDLLAEFRRLRAYLKGLKEGKSQ